jgi:pyrroloquinoline quinone (PQQ) biosynthesis protein C
MNALSGAESLVAEIRRELRPIEERLLRHGYLAALEAGRVPRESLRIFAGEQYAIIGSDLRSVAHLVSRFGDAPERDFFLAVLQGERAAWDNVIAFARALGMEEAELRTYEPLPGAHAYTCYMAWLGLYGSAAEVAAAYLVNFPAWGRNCGRMGRILRDRYGLSAPDVRFFDDFAAPPPEFEPAALAVIQAGLDRGGDRRLIGRAARLLQAYEALYWDTLEQASAARGP